MKTAAIILGWMIIIRYLISIHEHLYTKAKLEQRSPSTTTTNSPPSGFSPERGMPREDYSAEEARLLTLREPSMSQLLHQLMQDKV